MTPNEVRAILPQFLDLARQAFRALVATHVNPDGDAVGSACAMSIVLNQLGVDHDLVCHNEPPSYLQFLPGSALIETFPPRHGYDLGILLDLESMSRLGSLQGSFDTVQNLVVIDHHVPHEAPGDLRIVSTKAPATCAILADLFLDSEIEMTPDLATCLLAGIVTDTGSFRFPNTTAHSLRLAARLIEAGGDLPRVSDEVYMSKDPAAVRLMGKAIERLKTDLNEALAWVCLPLQDFQAAGASEEHTEGIVNEILSMKPVQIALVLREGKPGKIRGSLRSRGDIDVASVAQQFGGGGHRNAAGIAFTGSIEDAEREIVAALRKCLASS